MTKVSAAQTSCPELKVRVGASNRHHLKDTFGMQWFNFLLESKQAIAWRKSSELCGMLQLINILQHRDSHKRMWLPHSAYSMLTGPVRMLEEYSDALSYFAEKQLSQS